MNEKGKPVYENFNLAQSFQPVMEGIGMGETLRAYKAKRSGFAEDLSKPLFVKSGEDWLMGLEYLIRQLEGEDIDKVNLHEEYKERYEDY